MTSQSPEIDHAVKQRRYPTGLLARTVSPGRGVWLVARREIKTRVSSRAFRISTALIIVAIAALVFIGHLAGNGEKNLTVGVTGQATALSAQLVTKTEASGLHTRTVTVADQRLGIEQVSKGRLDALVSGAPGSLSVTAKDHVNGILRSTLDGLVRQQVLDGQLAGAGLNPRSVQQTLARAGATVHTLRQPDPNRGARLAVGFIVTVLLFLSIQLFGQAVAQGVVEEKSSRVVEILLAALRPWQLLSGKVLGVGIAGLVQLLLVGVVGGIVGSATGYVTLPPDSASIIGISLLWYVLGFFLFASLLAGAASTVSRQEELAGVIAPITILLLVPYIVGITAITTNPDSTLVRVLSFIPPFSPILMPSRSALGLVPAWQQILVLLLNVLALLAALWLGSRIYANAVLRTGSKVRLREALRT